MIGTLLKPATPPLLAKLKQAAQHYPCVLCGQDKSFTVGAHCNDLNLFPRDFGWIVGKGGGTKAPDFLLAYVCNFPGGCHDKIDGRAGGLTKEAKRELWNEAYKRTVALWFLEGLVRVA